MAFITHDAHVRAYENHLLYLELITLEDNVIDTDDYL